MGAVRRLRPLPCWSPPTAELGVRHLAGTVWGNPWRLQRFAVPNHCWYQRTICSISSVVIAVLMFVAVKSLPATLAILINLPLGLVGGLVAILLTGGVLSVASLIGFITLFGVAVRNGLLLVDNYNRRHAEGMELKEVIRAGSLQRLNAILMTALTSALGTLPLALAFGAGNEILQPLAIVVLGGLITSTLLTLLVLPALYARFGRWLLPRATAEA